MSLPNKRGTGGVISLLRIRMGAGGLVTLHQFAASNTRCAGAVHADDLLTLFPRVVIREARDIVEDRHANDGDHPDDPGGLPAAGHVRLVEVGLLVLGGFYLGIGDR